MFQPEDILAMVSGSYGLVLHELDVEPFLNRCRNLTRADNVTFIRWLHSSPETQLTTCVGEPIKLTNGFKHWLDTCLSDTPELPIGIDELAEQTPASAPEIQAYIKDPRLMAVLMDTQPSRILVLHKRNSSSPAWTDAERDSYMQVAAVMRQSVRLHKYVDAMKGAIVTAKGLFNSSPSGMIIMQPDGKINLANRMANRILSRNDGISIHNDSLLIRHKPLHEELQKLLSRSVNMTADETRGFKWHRGIPRREAKTAYQLSIHMLSLPEWHIESRRFDKVIVVFLADPLSVVVPNMDQLKRFYGFTDAQAKVALALWGGTGIGEAAKKLSISINTARTHLRAIYEKTGVTSHAELMAVLTTSLNRVSGMVDDGEFFEPEDPPPNF